MKKALTFLLLALFIFAFPVQSVQADTRDSVTVNITSKFDETNTASTTVSQDYGTKVSFAASLPGDDTGYEFAFWIVNGVVRRDLAQSAEIVVTSNMTLVGVFHPLDSLKYAVVFMDANGKVLKIEYVASAGTATAPSISELSKPGYIVDTDTTWVYENNPEVEATLSSITDNTVVLLNYVIDTTNYYTVHDIDGAVETSQNNLVLNTVVSVTADQAPAEEYFNNWTNAAGKIVSYEPTYSFTVVENTTLTANYSGTPNSDLPYVVIGNKLSLHDGKSSFIGQFHLPSGYTLVEYGLLTKADTSSFVLGDDGTTKYQGNKYNPTTDEFLISVPTAASTYVKAYLVVENGSQELEYLYSTAELLAISDLMFSEYGEGSSNNKWIEIYNPTNASVDLSAYTVEYFGNGANTSTPIALSGTLLSGDVFVVANTSAAPSILSSSDLTSGSLQFNGDDAFALFKGSVLLDTFGIIGQDPGSSWVFDTLSTVDKTLVRRIGVVSPSSSWNPYEWDVYAIDTIDNLGYHENDNVSSITITGATTLMAEKTTQLSMTYDPLDSTRGVTWESSSDLIATVDANGLVTGVAEGEVTITATSTSNDTITDTHVISVSPAVYWTITYHSNGGSDVDSDSVLDGTSATPPTPPTYTGYTFSGWFKDDSTFLLQYNFSTPVTADVDLYAKWVAEGGVTYADDLFISEYIEGSGTIRALEIYNGTAGSIDLSSYKIVNYYNGNTTVSASYMLSLSGSLSSGGVLVIYYTSGATQALIDAANTADITISSTSSTMNYNGDDAIALQKNDGLGNWSNIDVIGQIGLDPGSAWSANGVSTANQTLVRGSTISSGDSNGSDTFDPSIEWSSIGANVFTNLGSHTMD